MNPGQHMPDDNLRQTNTSRPVGKINKKEQIISLFLSGMTDVEDLAAIIGARPSYVGSVLQEAGLVKDYFDLYTSTSHPMNIYSKFFAGKLGFKDEETARAGVETIDGLYKQFGIAQDRAGQHHALSMALTMFDRARWTGKGPEAEIYRQWLVSELEKSAYVEADEDDFNGQEFDSNKEELSKDIDTNNGSS